MGIKTTATTGTRNIGGSDADAGVLSTDEGKEGAIMTNDLEILFTKDLKVVIHDGE